MAGSFCHSREEAWPVRGIIGGGRPALLAQRSDEAPNWLLITAGEGHCTEVALLGLTYLGSPMKKMSDSADFRSENLSMTNHASRSQNRNRGYPAGPEAAQTSAILLTSKTKSPWQI